MGKHESGPHKLPKPGLINVWTSGTGMSDWRDRCMDPDEWMAPFRDDRVTEEPEEVNSLIRDLLDRRVLSRMKRVRTSLRRRDNGHASEDQEQSGVE